MTHYIVQSKKISYQKTMYYILDDSDDDGDGVADEFDKDDEDTGDKSVRSKGKGSSGSGPWGSLVFVYYFGLTQYILKTAWTPSIENLYCKWKYIDNLVFILRSAVIVGELQ